MLNIRVPAGMTKRDLPSWLPVATFLLCLLCAHGGREGLQGLPLFL